MDGKKVRLALIGILFALNPLSLQAAVIEISTMVAYNASDLADGYKSTQHRLSGSIDFKFTPVSALQFEYMQGTTEISYNTTLGNLITIPTRESITYRDTVYSFNWVQNLVSTKFIIQPYVLVGGGHMTRKIIDELPQYGFKQTTTENVTTGTGGVGLRFFLTRAMAIKAEAKTYVPNFQFSKWKENQMMSLGLSWSF